MSRRDLVTVVVSALVGAGLAWMLARPAPPAPPQPARLAVGIPPGQRLDAVAVSPDGSRVVYAAEGESGLQLYRRALDRFEIEPMAGTEGAHSPFFSPDSQWVGFFAGGRLRKIRVEGAAAAEDVCEAPADSAGAAWGDDGSIVFAPLHGRGLVKASASGGEPQPLTQPDARAGEMAHGWPQVLPAGRGVIFTVSRRGRDSRIAVLTADGKTRQLSFPVTGQARYVSAGYLVYGFLGELLAVPFDVDALRPRGSPVSVARGLRSSRGFDDLEMSWFSSSRDGAIAYVPGAPGDPSAALVWVDRQGRPTPLSAPPAQYQSPRVSQDGARLAVAVRSGLMARDLWVHDVARETRVRLSTEGGDNQSPVWMPDGRRLTYASTKDGSQNIYVKPLDEGAEPQLLVAGGVAHNPSSWSRDGRVLAYYDVDPAKGRDIWILDRDGVIKPVLATPANERAPSLSPDGAWMTYVSDESGADEIYVRSTETAGTARRLSTGGGTEPVWARGGGEIFYREADRMMVVPVTAGPSFSAGPPRLVFERPYLRDPAGNLPDYDVSPDGQRFVMLQQADSPTELRIVLNWLADAAAAGQGR